MLRSIVRDLLGDRRFTARAGAAALAMVVPSVVSAQSAAPDRPNFLVIMADDIGYSDIGAFGGNIDTPNLDALAQRGLRFTNFYNMSRCCPSRASLLTGRYPHRVNMAGNGTSLSLTVPTVAEELRTAGYATAMVGKWHLTAATPLPDPAEHLKWLNHQAHFDRDFGDRRTYPTARGFDEYYGIIWGVADFYDPFSLVDGETPVRSVPKGFYLTDALSDRAAGSVRRLAQGRKPFMMYLAYTAAHWPLMAPEPVIQKYLPRFAGGWDALRTERMARLRKLGLAGAEAPPPPTTGYVDNADIPWAKLTPAQRTIQVRKMATHAAMIDIMDQGIGRVVQALKDSGAYDNTVILFLSDNGASPEIMVNPGYDRPSETRDGRKIAYGEYPENIGTDMTMAGIGTGWASAANAPWRWWKREQYEGGTHTPFLVSWPAGIGRRAGGKVAEAAHVIDIAPTLLDLAGARPRREGVPPVDGVSIAGTFRGGKIARAQPLFFEHYGARGIRDGRWKLVSLAPKANAERYLPWRLYDLSRDRSETTDVAARYPAVHAQLDGKWQAWAREVGVPPRAEPAAKVSDR
jgi:arylsulfatase